MARAVYEVCIKLCVLDMGETGHFRNHLPWSELYRLGYLDAEKG